MIYKPTPESDDGKIVLPISTLKNPLEGTFNLSQCGDASKYLSISTGYQKKAENADEVEIWLTPRFLIEKELNMAAKPLQEIYSKWKENASVGIFWTWPGRWGDLEYDYLITQDMDEISDNNLYIKYTSTGNAHCRMYTDRPVYDICLVVGQQFRFIL